MQYGSRRSKPRELKTVQMSDEEDTWLNGGDASDNQQTVEHLVDDIRQMAAARLANAQQQSPASPQQTMPQEELEYNEHQAEMHKRSILEANPQVSVEVSSATA